MKSLTLGQKAIYLRFCQSTGRHGSYIFLNTNVLLDIEMDLQYSLFFFKGNTFLIVYLNVCLLPYLPSHLSERAEHRAQNNPEKWGGHSVQGTTPYPDTVPLAILEGGVPRNIPAAPAAYCRKERRKPEATLPT